jgi:hypothetical protein
MAQVNRDLAGLTRERRQREEQELKDRVAQERLAQRDIEAAQREAEREQREILREREREFTEYYGNAVSVLQEALLDPTKEGWDDTLKDMFAKFKRWIASLAIEAAARPILVPMVSAFFGAGVSGAANAATGSASPGTAAGSFSPTSLTNLLSGFRQGNTGFADGVTRLVANLGGAGNYTALNNAMLNLSSPAGLLGGFAGNMLANALFTPRQGPGSAIGGTLGAIAGSFIPVPFVGTAIGSFLGSALGGLVGPKPSDRMEGSILNMLTGQVREEDLGPNKDSPANREAVNSFVGFVQQLKSVLERGTGGRINVGEVRYHVGDRSGVQLGIDGPSQTYATPQAAAQALIESFVGKIEGVAPRVKRAIDLMDWTNLEQSAQDLDKVLNFENAIKQLAEQADEKSPIQQLFQSITDNFAVLGEEMKKFGYTQEELASLQDKAFGAARAALLKDRTTEFYDATGRGYLNAIGGVLGADKSRRADDLAAGIDSGMSASIFASQLKSALDTALGDATDYASAVAIIADIKTQFAAYPDILAAADAALGRFQTTLQSVPIVVDRGALLDARRSDLYGATGRGYLNDIGGVLRDYTKRSREDGSDAELIGITKAIFGADIKSVLDRALGDATDYASAVAIIADIKTQFGAYPDILAAADSALGRFQSSLNTLPPTVEALGPLRDLSSLLVGLYDDQLDALDRQAAALKDSAEGWQRLSDTIRKTRQSFGLDSQLSPYSLERRVQESMRLYRETATKAQGGDLQAAADLPEVSRTALELAREFYRSSSDYTAIFDEIQSGLRSTESFASRQLTVEQLQLTALEAIRQALVASRDAVRNPAGTATANAADWANLGNSYEAAKGRFLAGGGSLTDWLNSSEHKTIWEKARDELVGGTTDAATLKAQLAAARDQKATPGFEATGTSWEATLLAQFQRLGIPAFARGGMVSETGLAFVHAGEQVLNSAQQDGIAREVRALSQQVAGLTRMMAEAQTRLIDATTDVAETNRAMADDARMSTVLAGSRGRVL